MNEKTYLLAIDLGASEAKCYCGVFDGANLTMSEIYKFAHEPVSLWLRDRDLNSVKTTIWEDTAIFRGITNCLKDFSKNVSNRLDSLSIDSWGADGQLITESDELFGRIFSYRGSDAVCLGPKESALNEKAVYNISGIPTQNYNIRNRLLWYSINRPELKYLKFTFLPVPTIFSCYLGAERKIDHTWASITQLMDIKKRKWSKTLVDSLGLPGLTLPQIVSPGMIIGYLHPPIAAKFFLNETPIIATASHDTAAAFYSVSAKPNGSTLIISSGTWSLVGKVIPQPILSPEAQKLKMSNQLGPDNVHFIRSITGHWIIQALHKMWLDESGHNFSREEIIQMAERSEPFKAIIDPDHALFFNPDRMTDAIDAFCLSTGQKPPSDRGMYLRTVFESLALKYRWTNNQVSNLSGTKTDNIRIVGGGSQNDLLNQFTADCIGLPVSAGPVQGSAIGNLMIQARGLDKCKNYYPIFQPGSQFAACKQFYVQSREGWHAAFEHFQRLAELREN